MSFLENCFTNTQLNRSGIFLFIRLQPYPAVPQQAVTPLCLFVLAPYPLAGTGHTGYHKISA